MQKQQQQQQKRYCHAMKALEIAPVVVAAAAAAAAVDDSAGWDVSRMYSAVEKCHVCHFGFLGCHIRSGDCRRWVLAVAVVVVVVDTAAAVAVAAFVVD